MSLSQDVLQRVLSYDSTSGDFIWKYTRSRSAKKGQQAGTLSHDGYVRIGLLGKDYLAHRLAWLYVHGVWEPLVEHKDGIGSHNWIDNLRLASMSQNLANISAHKDNACGYKGVWKVGKRYCAQISKQGIKYSLGTFATPEEAHEVYCQTAVKLFGEFARPFRHRKGDEVIKKDE